MILLPCVVKELICGVSQKGAKTIFPVGGAAWPGGASLKQTCPIMKQVWKTGPP